MSIFGRESIRSKVMKSINAKLDAMDKEFKDECTAIDKKAEETKDQLGVEMADSILKKFI